MKLIDGKSWLILAFLLMFFCGNPASAQNTSGCAVGSGLSGVYRIDADESDKLYSIIENAASNLPYNRQQQFFMDLAVRLTPPDLLAIECRGNRVSLGSSRAQRIDFVADGAMRKAGGGEGRSRIAFERGSLVFTSSGGTGDNLNFTFTPLENGRRLRVTRRISSRELIEPVVIQTFYSKINEVVRWDVYGADQLAGRTTEKPDALAAAAPPRRTRPAANRSGQAETVRRALDEWIDATNARDIGRQMAFYMPEMKAYYLSRNATRNSVRVDKTRTFAAAKSIDIRAAEPEIIFQNGGQTAVMRFRKKYNIANRAGNRRGEVVQELRWQQTNGGWKIFSERDIKVIS